MRLLLDENFPTDFAKHFAGHQIHSVHNLGWQGIANGDLLRRAKDVCDVFVTPDRNLQFQQNVKILPLGIVFVRALSNRLADLTPHVRNIIEAAEKVSPGQVESERPSTRDSIRSP